MSTPVIMDAAAVGVVFLLTLIGMWRGLWKTLMGLAALILAAFLASLVVSAFAAPLTDRAVSYVMERAEEKIQEKVKSQTEDATASLQDALADISSVPGYDAATDTLPIKQIPALLERIGLTGERRDSLMEQIREKLSSLGQSTADSARVALEEIVRQILGPAIRAGLYGVSFLLFSIVLKFVLGMVGKTLDKIPALKTLNHTGGMVLGLAEGLLLLTAVGWVIGTAGLTASPPLSETVVLKFLAEHSLLDLLPMAQTQV